MDLEREWVRIASASQIPNDGMMPVRVGQRDIALYKVDGELYATDNICTHANAYLTDGWLEEGIVECPLHGGRFDVKTGFGLCPPITCNLRSHQVRVSSNDVYIKLSS